MLEQLCYSHLKELIRPVYKKHQPLVLLKGRERSEQYKDYMNDRFTWYPNVQYSQRNSVQCTSYLWFMENGKDVVRIFLDTVYGTIEKAMDSTENCEDLFQKFLDWFDEKRRDFRMSFDIQECKTELLKNGKRPNSHGGVANLLKTLTKTMEKQGADIANVARVQYEICMRAGIYIPDEFLEDVAVALNMGEEKQ